MQLIYRIYYFLITRLRSQRWLAEILFKVKIPAEVEGPYWDYTTLLLQSELPGFLRNDMKILEIGIGRAAVLLASFNKKISGDCTGVDLQPEFVSSARKVLQCNAIENVEVFQSDLFENVTGLYDLIFFNSIYIKTEWGRKYLADYVDSTWDGGGNGMETISRFVKSASAYLKPAGAVLLGVNSYYVQESEIRKAMEQTDLRVAEIIRKALNPSRIYVLKAKHK